MGLTSCGVSEAGVIRFECLICGVSGSWGAPKELQDSREESIQHTDGCLLPHIEEAMELGDRDLVAQLVGRAQEKVKERAN